jgi:hypothetical protein
MNIELSPKLNALLIIEEVFLFIGSVLLFGLTTEYSWWMYVLLFFLPDISFAAYLINTKTGAFFYNLLHHKGLMVGLILLGYFTQLPLLLTIGIVFFGHSCFDRIFGYGLKFDDNFKHTHLGYLNQAKKT